MQEEERNKHNIAENIINIYNITSDIIHRLKTEASSSEEQADCFYKMAPVLDVVNNAQGLLVDTYMQAISQNPSKSEMIAIEKNVHFTVYQIFLELDAAIRSLRSA